MADKEKKEKKNVSAAAQEAAGEAQEAQAQEAAEAAPAEETAEEAPAEEKTEAADAEALRKQVETLNDRLLRTLAEYDNFRRRSQKEKEALYGDVKAETIAKFLPAIDNFERASTADSDFESYKKGIEMTVKQLFDILASLGVEAFGEKGEPFDPNVHNGVMHEDNGELDENTVSEVFLKGYKMGDRVIRHATVKVAN